MNIYYVIGTEVIKNKEVTEERAIPAADMNHLKILCDVYYIRWEFVRGPYKMNKFWDY